MDASSVANQQEMVRIAVETLNTLLPKWDSRQCAEVDATWYFHYQHYLPGQIVAQCYTVCIYVLNWGPE